MAPALEALRREGVAAEVFDGVVADPPEAVVLDAVARARAFDADAVIGLGGGSSLDVAKLVALLLAGGEALADVYGVGIAKGPRLPLLLAPTTAGTGSEVTPISIVTTGAHEKKGVVSPLLLPDIALLDPDLTLGLPPAVTAATGVDAMVHAIEAFTSVESEQQSDLARPSPARPCASSGAISAGRCITARTATRARGCSLGSMLAGQAFANAPVAAVHALAYPIGGHFGVPHGLSNALVLPHVLRFNASACADSYAALAPHAFPELTHASADAFIEAVTALAADLRLPPRLRDVGIPADAVPMMAEDAMKQTRLLVNNPRPMTLADARAIYEAAW